MKAITILLAVLLATTFVEAQELNSNASYIKETYSAEYEQTLKKHALNKWEDDFNMVVHEINKQAEALVKFIDEFKGDNTNIAFNAIQKWSKDGYESKNTRMFKEMETVSLENLLKMHCNWNMVKHEYDKQVKAKNSF